MEKSKILNLARLIARFAEVATDKGTLISDGELAEGVEVFVEADGELKPAEDGEYTQENGDVIVVAEGKVSEIRKAEPEEEKTEETVEEEVTVAASKKDRFDAVKAQFEASYQEIEQNIYSALADTNIWGYLLENGDDYAIVSVWDDEDGKEHLYRYDITIAEDGFVTLGERKEVRIEYVPIDEEPKEEEPKEEEIVEEVKEEVKEEEFEKETPAFREMQNDEATANISLAEAVRKTVNK